MKPNKTGAGVQAQELMIGNVNLQNIITEVMSQHFKIQDDYTYENVVDAINNAIHRFNTASEKRQTWVATFSFSKSGRSEFMTHEFEAENSNIAYLLREQYIQQQNAGEPKSERIKLRKWELKRNLTHTKLTR